MPPTTDAPQDDQDQQAEAADAQADGYYGEDLADDDELDLSFLDEDDDKAEGPGQPPVK